MFPALPDVDALLDDSVAKRGRFGSGLSFLAELDVLRDGPFDGCDRDIKGFISFGAGVSDDVCPDGFCSLADALACAWAPDEAPAIGVKYDVTSDRSEGVAGMAVRCPPWVSFELVWRCTDGF
jgi:hypothetical protein